MSAEAVAVPAPQWHSAVALDKLRSAGQLSVKLQGRQIALFLHGERAHACNNRCPHEGYPLAEGHLAEGCRLTCQWHNWTFDLRSGENLYGGDNLRIYPTRMADGQVWVDLADEPPAIRMERALGQIEAALAEHDLPRLARELARLEAAGGTPEQAVARAISGGHDKLRYGMSHAHAAAEVWLSLRDELAQPAQRLACVSEACGYLGFEVLRQPHYPYSDAVLPWDASAFAAAAQAQDEAAALARLHGALQGGASIASLMPQLCQAALAHYADFGHSLIYLPHMLRLEQRLGTGVTRPLLRAWLRSVLMATREDLLPDFKSYAPALTQWLAEPPPTAGLSDTPPDSAAFEGQSVRKTLAAVQAAAAQHTPQALLQALMQAGAHHLLRFDEQVATRSDGPVADNVGWLDFSHALTFGQALRQLLSADSPLWPQGLLQMALFLGRNTAYLQAEVSSAQAMAPWRMGDEAALHQRCQAQVLDHGLGLDIFAVHWLKTWRAVQASIAMGLSDEVQASLLAAVHRLFCARFKQRHVLRNAQQALAFVARES